MTVNRWFIFSLMLALLFFGQLTRVNAGVTQGGVKLTPAEISWIAAHPVIQLGVDPEFAPFEFIDEKGRYQGITSDYIAILNKRLGLNMRVVPGLTWQEAVKKAEARDVDILPSIGKTEARGTFLNFSEPYVHFLRAIITRSDWPDEINGLNDLTALRVAVQASSSHEGYLRDHSTIEPMTYSTLQASLMALSNGEVDAFIGNIASATYWIRKMNLNNLKVVAQVSQDIQSLHFGIRNDWPELQGILQKGLDSIDTAERISISRRWVSVDLPSSASEHIPAKLTQKERVFLKKRNKIRLGIDSAWPPIEFFSEQGEYQGIASEYIAYLSASLGVEMLPELNLTWAEVIDRAKVGEIDLLPAVVRTESREKYLNFTKPYLSSPLVIFTRNDAAYVNSLSDLKGKQVVVERSDMAHEILQKKHANIQLVLMENSEMALARLVQGDVDAYVGSLVVASYVIGLRGYTNLKVAAPTPYSYDLSMGVRKDWPELIPILQRALDNLDAEKKTAILQKWLAIQYKLEVDYRLVWQISMTAVIILIIILLLNHSVRKQKKRLRISDERFQLAMQTTSGGLWDWNIVTDEIYYSPSYLGMLGYTSGELSGHRKTWENLLHPDDKEAALAVVDDAIRHAVPHYKHEFRLRAKNGNYLSILSKGGVVSQDSDGRALRSVGTQTDISDLKQVEDSLQTLSLAVEQSPAMVMITDPLGVVEYVNAKFTEITGYTSQEIIGQTPALLQSGLTEPHVYQEMWQTIRAGQVWQGEIQNKTKSGNIYWEQEIISPLLDASGNILHYIAMKEDISSRQVAEERLKVFQRFAETSGQGFGIATLDGQLTYVNQTLRKMLKEVSNDLIYNKNFLEYYSPTSQLKIQQVVLPALQEKGQWTGELTLISAKNEQLPTLENLFVIRNEQGKARYFGNVITDITLQKNTEQALQEAKVQAELASRFKGEFLANMSHEIRTPLNAIMGMTYLTQKTSLSVQQQDYLNNILFSSRTLLGVINDILDFSKIEAGRLDIEFTNFLLSDIFQNLSSLEAVRAKEKGVEIIYKIDDDVPSSLIGDPLRLGQVLINLLSNAIKFTEQGSVVVAVTLHEKNTDRVILHFSVQDTGIGIESQQAAKLFDPFVQADGSITRKYGGSGLGLAISKQLVTMMGGGIGVDSELGCGSTFYFTVELGYSSNFQGSSALLVENVEPRFYKTHILVVEDNRINQQVAKKLLEIVGIEVTVAGSGTSALQAIQKNAFDLVLMDLQMPDLDGYQTTQAIRKKAQFKTLPIVAMTAHAMKGDREKCLAVGMNDHLPKPIDPALLYRTLSKWVSSSKQIQEPITTVIDSGEEGGEPSMLPASLPGIDMSQGLLRIGGSRQLFRTLLFEFVEDHREDVATLKNTLKVGDMSQARRIVHTLRSVAGSIGAEQLEKSAEMLELAFINEQAYTDLLKPFADEFNRVLEGLVAVRGMLEDKSEPIKEKTIETQKQWAEWTQALEKQLSAGHIDARKNLDQCRPYLCQHGTATQLKLLENQVANYDFDDALITLKQILRDEGELK